MREGVSVNFKILDTIKTGEGLKIEFKESKIKLN